MCIYTSSTEDKKNILYRRVGIALLTVVLLISLIFLCAVYEAGQQADVSQASDGAEQSFSELYVTDTGNGKAGVSTHINWWYNELADEYELFLPSSVDNTKLRLGLRSADYAIIDGEKVYTDEKFSLSPGSHQVMLGEAQDGESDKGYKLQVFQSANVATVYVNTESGSMEKLKADKEHEESGTIAILDADGNVEYGGVLEKIHGRGNSTWDDGVKLPYTIKLPKKTNLFQMGAAKSWVLLANQWDATLLRNYVVHDIARTSQMPFTAESVFVDFYTNGDYQGTYQLSEKVEVDSERVDITDLEKRTEHVNYDADLFTFPLFGATDGQQDTTPSTMKGYQIENNPSDITGGYLITMDMGYTYLKKPAGFVTSRNQAMRISEPAHPSAEQVYYIANLYQEMEDAIYAWDGINPNTGKSYVDYMDVDSFARRYLIEEISKNLDASTGSQYIYKDIDQISTKFYAGPVWDYDKSLGNGGTDGYNSTDLTDPTGMYANQDLTASCIWYAVFFRPEFSQSVVSDYYTAFRDNTLAEADSPDKIDQWSDELHDSVVMNAVRWNMFGGKDKDEILQGYQQEIDTMKNFIRDRITYLDTQWVKE